MAGENGLAQVGLRATTNGYGTVATWDKEGKVQANMFSNEYGGVVTVAGKDELQRAVMQVGPDGNGVVAAWDKNGHLLR